MDPRFDPSQKPAGDVQDPATQKRVDTSVDTRPQPVPGTVESTETVEKVTETREVARPKSAYAVVAGEPAPGSKQQEQAQKADEAAADKS